MTDLLIQPKTPFTTEQKKASVITFRKRKEPKVIDKCSFCGTAIEKGKFIQSDMYSPAICFSCVVECNHLLEEPT